MSEQQKIGRRGFLGGALGSVAGLLGWRPGGSTASAAMIQGEALKPLVAAGTQHPTDVTALVRSWFANRTPVLARFPWVPTDKDEFTMFTHRYVRPGDMDDHATIGAATGQKVQRFQFPVEHGDPGVERRPGFLPGGGQSPFEFNTQLQLQNMTDDAEVALYYGDGIDGQYGPKTRGLRSILVSNRIRRSYRGAIPISFFEEMIHACRCNGGCPDLFLVSTDLRKAECLGLEPVEGGCTELGQPIRIYASEAIPRVSFVECPLLRRGTAVALTSAEVLIRSRDNPHLEKRSETVSDWKCSLAIDVVNEQHHCWAEATVEKGES